MAAKRRGGQRLGDIVAIPIGDGRTGYGLFLDSPLVAFFDLCSTNEAHPVAEVIVSAPVAFRIWVMKTSWPVIGRVTVPDHLREEPWFFKQDPISGEVSVTRTGEEELPPEEEHDLDKMECAAVWSDCHVVDRLRDHFDGVPSGWVESMRVKK